MENFSELVDALVEELPDFISSFLLVGICIIYVIVKMRVNKKKGIPNNNQQRNNPYSQTTNRARHSYDRPNAQLFGESSAMPHEHRKAGVYDTYNKKSWWNNSGTMPHKHETGHHTSMMDVNRLPKGYILLNGEPVRVADLEGK